MSSFAATYTFGKTYDPTVVPALVAPNGTELQTLVKNAYDSMLKIWGGGRIKASIYKQIVSFNNASYQVIYDTKLP
jgi:hypothetical protein